eukprot:m.5788 g.5788  ORF g.5788 m.5788 type:complete len:165 (+) comp3397_c0_seq1:40-534(+)
MSATRKETCETSSAISFASLFNEVKELRVELATALAIVRLARYDSQVVQLLWKPLKRKLPHAARYDHQIRDEVQIMLNMAKQQGVRTEDLHWMEAILSDRCHNKKCIAEEVEFGKEYSTKRHKKRRRTREPHHDDVAGHYFSNCPLWEVSKGYYVKRGVRSWIV